MNHAEKLNQIYQRVVQFNESELTELKNEIPEQIKKYINTIADRCRSNKGVYTVLVTLLVHKSLYPQQDIRYHQEQLDNGFPGRTIDTKYITPTLRKLKLPAMAESGWLKRSLEQPYPYTRNYQGRIGHRKVKVAFLEIIDYIQNINPRSSDSILLLLLKKVKEVNDRAQNVKISPLDNPERLTIDFLIDSISLHFNTNYHERGASKLPVLAFYAIFSLLIQQLERYQGCKLKPLGSHTASDLTSKTAGDIEIIDAQKNLIEAI